MNLNHQLAASRSPSPASPDYEARLVKSDHIPQMEESPNWTATALFSPSKARAQQAQAKDWAFIEAWLSKKYGKRLPPFERNEETLQALLNLANINETADEQQSLVERVEKLSLSAMTKRAGDEQETFTTVASHLDQDVQECLESLAEASVLLGACDIIGLASQASSLTCVHFDVLQQARRVDAQRSALERESGRLKHLLEEVNDPSFTVPADWPEQTTAWLRNTKQLRAKVSEYRERLDALREMPSHTPTIEDVAKRAEEVAKLRKQAAVLDSQLSAFQSLPTDPRAGQKKLEAAKEDLRDLILKRDRLFEGMVEGNS